MIVSVGDTSKHAGFTLTWDNVQIESRARHQMTSNQNKFLLWALALCTYNRVKPEQMDPAPKVAKAAEIPVQRVLPDEATYAALFDGMVLEAEKTLQSNCPWLQKAPPPEAIKHQYSHLMTQKSEIVSILCCSGMLFS